MINIYLCEYRLCSGCSCLFCFVLGFGPLIWWLLRKLWFDVSCGAPLFVDVFLAAGCAQYRACDAPLWDVCYRHLIDTVCEDSRFLLLRGVHRKKKKSHLPNSKITAQTRRTLSTRPPFEPNKFAKDIFDHITAAGAVSIPAGWRSERGKKDGKEKETEGVEKRAVSCVPGWHKFFLVKAAIVPQIPSEWLNGAFQSCVGQWERRDREASRVCLAAAGGALAAWNGSTARLNICCPGPINFKFHKCRW